MSTLEHRDYRTDPPTITSHPADELCEECGPERRTHQSTPETKMSMTRDQLHDRTSQLHQWFAEQERETPNWRDFPEIVRTWNRYQSELTHHQAALDQLEARDDHLRELARSGSYESGSGPSPAHTGGHSRGTARDQHRAGNDFRGQALRAIDQLHRMPDAAREYGTQQIEADDDVEQRLARVTAALADQDYFRAFTKWHNDPLTGMHLWTPKEREAVSRVKTLERSFGLGAQGGGFLTPYELDPAVILATLAASIRCGRWRG
jgi:hypothetical protein